jgi:hypothetical protein
VPEAQWTFEIGRTSRVDQATKLPRQCDEPFHRSFAHLVGAQQKRFGNCQPNALARPSRTKIVWPDNLERQQICDGHHTSKEARVIGCELVVGINSGDEPCPSLANSSSPRPRL